MTRHTDVCIDEIDDIVHHPAWQGWNFVQVAATASCNEESWLRLTGCVQLIVQKYLSQNVQLHTIMTRRTNKILLLHKPLVPELVHYLSAAVHHCLASNKVELTVKVRDLTAELKN